ncbi:NAD(P)-dependent oxidoreductase [Psychroflexus halocasei]|uniref:D-3-phosphoglycerate dehydrogenase n=1 Tax=Psychroflexus halocasei TaxID=908615 RepID=A0A1H3ZI13_9FLAO|nr:NAD(P)-dependent oxidoreductase [Psychroflexus halocasei]SEA23061.1 D-3-phosphoglycerate dehydrogenase [Psychroflexus halocasei]
MNILINDGLSASAVKLLEDQDHKLYPIKVAQSQLVNYINKHHIEAIIIGNDTKINSQIIDACTDLKIIAKTGSELNNIDFVYAKTRGLKVFNSPDQSSESVAELVIAHALSCMRHLKNTNRDMPLEGDQRFTEIQKAAAKGQELKGKTIGIIGFEKLGQTLAQKAIALGMKILAYDPKVNEAQVNLEFFDQQKLSFKIETTDLETLLTESDIISLHTPRLKKPILSAKEFQKMKPTAGVINTSFGGVLDEVELVNALHNNTIAFAALDVFENEPHPEIQILMQDKISLSPHISGSTLESQERIGLHIAQQIINFDKN